jgi:hypothetical protein
MSACTAAAPEVGGLLPSSSNPLLLGRVPAESGSQPDLDLVPLLEGRIGQGGRKFLAHSEIISYFKVWNWLAGPRASRLAARPGKGICSPVRVFSHPNSGGRLWIAFPRWPLEPTYTRLPGFLPEAACQSPGPRARAAHPTGSSPRPPRRRSPAGAQRGAQTRSPLQDLARSRRFPAQGPVRLAGYRPLDDSCSMDSGTVLALSCGRGVELDGT